MVSGKRNQPPNRHQVTRREADLWDGIRELDRLRERAREKIRTEGAAFRAQLEEPKQRKAKPKPKTGLNPRVALKTPPPPEPEAEAPEPRTTAEFMKARQRELKGES